MDINGAVAATSNDLSSAIYYIGGLIVAIFSFGWFFNSKIKAICTDVMQDMSKIMTDLAARLAVLETNALRVQQHDKDMNNIYNLINEVKNDVREGFADVAKRIDSMLLSNSNKGS